VITIRLEGLPDDVAAAVEQIGATFDLLETSQVYYNRPPSKLVRQYLKADVRAGGPQLPTSLPFRLAGDEDRDEAARAK
jgi:hypothetical protein